MAYGRLKEHGMAKVEKYYGDYGIRAKELNKQGRSVIAYLCSLVPVEIIEIQSGPYLEEDDIVRYDDVYGRIKEEKGREKIPEKTS